MPVAVTKRALKEISSKLPNHPKSPRWPLKKKREMFGGLEATQTLNHTGQTWRNW